MRKLIPGGGGEYELHGLTGMSSPPARFIQLPMNRMRKLIPGGGEYERLR